MLGVKKRIKTFRDPVHGDIRVGPLQRAVIDTDTFQRLRYIRQNGLLHYVFPGAVHTRFAHSIGTMHVAQRVFAQLFPSYRSGEKPEAGQLSGLHCAYVGVVFELAALCHDIGHCAFSHSIESLSSGDNGGASLFKPFDEYVAIWRGDFPALGRWWDIHKEKARVFVDEMRKLDSEKRDWLFEVKHEELGILFMVVLLNNPTQPHIEATFNYLFDDTISFAHFCQDVVALMRGESWLPYSPSFMRALESLVKEVPLSQGQVIPDDKKEAATSQLAGILHELISGTLDVDRFDYLLRDSKYSGTVCGVFDLEILINSLALRFVPASGLLALCVFERAEWAIDDFLWSRFQLYEQIISHKANVMLNALFPKAVGPLVGGATISIPIEFTDFLSFTDDSIMAKVRKSLIEKPPKGTTKDSLERGAFLRTKLPRYLRRVSLADCTDKQQEDILITNTKLQLAGELGNVSIDKIFHSISRTELVKQTAPLPRVIRRLHLPGSETSIERLEAGQFKSWQGGPTFSAKTAHFFTEPDGA